MSWERVIIHESELGLNKDSPLVSKIDALIIQQQGQWQLLRDNIQNLSRAKTKTVRLGHFEVVVQCNPERIQNTTAKVDYASTQQRPCKLCVEHLFEGQKGLAYRDRLVILCNPYPILNHHLSIVDRIHVRQAIHGRLDSLLTLAKDLSYEFVVFYNGPQCGASTPEHFHVQACARDCIPIIKHLTMIGMDPTLHVHKQKLTRKDGIEVFALQNYHAALLVYRGTNRTAIITWIELTLKQFADLSGTSQEPLINLLFTYDAPVWSVCLFPRAAHRPVWYFEGTFTVSPASLDMAGWLVVPVEQQFHQIREEHVKQIFAEVTLDSSHFSQLIHAIMP